MSAAINQMSAPAPKASRRPVPVVSVMEAVMAGPGHPEAGDGPALRVEPRCGTRRLVTDGRTDGRQAELTVRIIQAVASSAPC
jgi:hypothetical protein